MDGMIFSCSGVLVLLNPFHVINLNSDWLVGREPLLPFCGCHYKLSRYLTQKTTRSIPLLFLIPNSLEENKPQAIDTEYLGAKHVSSHLFT